MTIKEIEIINESLKIDLPRFYVKYMLNFPEIMKKIHNLYEGPTYSNFYNNYEDLIRINKILGFYNESKFIKNMFCIGENGGGDFVLIDLNNKVEKVFCFDHEEIVSNNEFNISNLEYYSSLDEYLDSIIEIFGIPK